MNQLFDNIIGNALKYSYAGRTPKILVRHQRVAGHTLAEGTAHKEGDYHKISVIDNGIGFEDQYASQIFNLFQRLHGKSEYPGTGIGLAICKKIVQNHGGHIRAVSKLNEGATFEVYLPA
jgi:signal transduction histidine kinase